jgi:hypothetical protein
MPATAVGARGPWSIPGGTCKQLHLCSVNACSLIVAEGQPAATTTDT